MVGLLFPVYFSSACCDVDSCSGVVLVWVWYFCGLGFGFVSWFGGCCLVAIVLGFYF